MTRWGGSTVISLTFSKLYLFPFVCSLNSFRLCVFSPLPTKLPHHCSVDNKCIKLNAMINKVCKGETTTSERTPFCHQARYGYVYMSFKIKQEWKLVIISVVVAPHAAVLLSGQGSSTTVTHFSYPYPHHFYRRVHIFKSTHICRSFHQSKIRMERNLHSM